MNARLDHQEVRGLFGALLDEELTDGKAASVREHLDGCTDCRIGWDRYARAIELVRKVAREKAPPSLASTILWRVRREGLFGARGLVRAHAHYRVPIEVMLPVVLGAAIAALILLWL